MCLEKEMVIRVEKANGDIYRIYIYIYIYIQRRENTAMEEHAKKLE